MIGSRIRLARRAGEGGWPGSTFRCRTRPTSRRWRCRSRKTSSRPLARSAIAEREARSMSINILMPALSPTMTEGKLAKWHVKVGDQVKSGQVVCEIETDKATMEVEAVDEGKVGQIVVPEGAEGVKVNAVIAVLLEEGETSVPGRRRRAAAHPSQPPLRLPRPQRSWQPPRRRANPARRRRKRQPCPPANASLPRRSPNVSRPRRASISPASRAAGSQWPRRESRRREREARSRTAPRRRAEGCLPRRRHSRSSPRPVTSACRIRRCAR